MTPVPGDLYRLGKDPDSGEIDTKSRDVVYLWGERNKIAFQCPCGLRTIYVYSPPYGIEFDGDGLLTLEGSVGFRASGQYPDNWCHLDITGGKASIYDDATCPGSGQGSE